VSKRVLALGAVDENGGVSVSHREQFIARVVEAFRGLRVVWIVEKETRSLRQNALYWGLWVDLIHKELGWDESYIHHWNKEHFNLRTESVADPKTGEIKDVSWPGDTHDMPKDAFSEFLERVQRGWAEKGIDLPWPDEYKKDEEPQ